jgi:hypothetical protein
MLDKLLTILRKYAKIILSKNNEDIDKSVIIGKNSIIRKVRMVKYSGINENCIIINTEFLD